MEVNKTSFSSSEDDEVQFISYQKITPKILEVIDLTDEPIADEVSDKSTGTKDAKVQIKGPNPLKVKSNNKAFKAKKKKQNITVSKNANALTKCKKRKMKKLAQKNKAQPSINAPNQNANAPYKQNLPNMPKSTLKQNEVEILEDVSNWILSKEKAKTRTSKENLPNGQTNAPGNHGNNHVQYPLHFQMAVKRPIVIDGSNVARSHTRNTYSCIGIQLCVEYFRYLGHHDIKVIVPAFMKFTNKLMYIHNEKEKIPVTHHEILQGLFNANCLTYTPSVCYDDRFVVELAARTNGVVVSNDNYNDIIGENKAFEEVIQHRLLKFCFAGDIFMIPQDPLGRNGPKLQEFLSFFPVF